MSISFRDKEVVPKFIVEVAACRTPYAETFTCGPNTWQAQLYSLPRFSIVTIHCGVMCLP